MAHNGNGDDDGDGNDSESNEHDVMVQDGREMTIKIKMINARVKKARGALARLSGNFHISTH